MKVLNVKFYIIEVCYDGYCFIVSLISIYELDIVFVGKWGDWFFY